MFDRLKFKRKTDSKDKDKERDANITSSTISNASVNDATSRSSFSQDDTLLESSSLVHRSGSNGSNASNGALHMNNS
ncbi:hypothetical protein BGZ92_005804, partial [Podila epicladia]